MRRLILPLAGAMAGLALCTPASPSTVSPSAASPSAQSPSAGSPRPTGTPGERRCTDHPTPECTGVPEATALKTLQPNFYDAYRVTKDGTVLDGVHVPGDLLITAHNVTIRNSMIDGQVQDHYERQTYSFTISDSTVGPATGCDPNPGLQDAGFTANRVHVRNHVDGFSVSGDNVKITNSFVSLCSRPGDHSDGIQTVGSGNGLVFHHNTVDQRKAADHTAPVFLVDPSTGVSVTDNLLMGGTYTLRLRAAAGTVAKNNAVVDGTWDYGPTDVDCASTQWSGNTIVRINAKYKITSTIGPLPCVG